MSLNANAKAWTPSFGGGAPAAAAAAPAAITPSSLSAFAAASASSVPPPAPALPASLIPQAGPFAPAAVSATPPVSAASASSAPPPPPPLPASILGASAAAAAAASSPAKADNAATNTTATTTSTTAATTTSTAPTTTTTTTTVLREIATPFTPMSATQSAAIGAGVGGYGRGVGGAGTQPHGHGHSGGYGGHHAAAAAAAAAGGVVGPYGGGGGYRGGHHHHHHGGGHHHAGGLVVGAAGPHMSAGAMLAAAGVVAPAAHHMGLLGGGAAPPETSDWYRYAVALPTARTVDNETNTANTFLHLQTRRALLSGRSRDKASFEDYVATYFRNTRNAPITAADAQLQIATATAGGVISAVGSAAGSLMSSPTATGPSPAAAMGGIGAAAAAGMSTSSPALPAQSPSALLLSRKLLGNPNQTEDIATVTNADGFLVQVVPTATQPGADLQYAFLGEAWAQFMETVGPLASVIGHWMLEVPELKGSGTTTVATGPTAEPRGISVEGGAAFYHYFYCIPLTSTSIPSAADLAARFTFGGKVTKVRSIISFIMCSRLPLAATVRVHSGAGYVSPPPPASSVSTPTSPADCAAAMASAIPAPTITLTYNANNHIETMESVRKALFAVERFLTPADATVVPATGASSSTTSSTVPVWSSTANVTIDLVDVTPAVAVPATAAASAAANSIIPRLLAKCVVPAFDVLQELITGLAAVGAGVCGFERVAKAGALSAPLEALLAAMKPAAFIAATATASSEASADTNTTRSNNTNNSGSSSASKGASKGATADRPLLVLSTRSALAVPWGTLPSVHAGGSYVSPIGSPEAYSGFRALVAGSWEALLNAEARTLALTTDKAAAVANVFAREPYVVRRSAVGTRVLLLADKQRQLAVFDPQTAALLSIPSASWSNQNVLISDSVFVGTLAHSYRGSRVWRVIVEDVYRFNGVDCIAKPFTERWDHVNRGVLESEGSYSHIPFGPVILHATYMNAHEVTRLLDERKQTAAPTPSEAPYFPEGYPINPHEHLEPVDHATLGLTYVPTMAPVVAPTTAAGAAGLLRAGADAGGPCYGADLPPRQPMKPRAVNIPAVRDVLRLVPTFTWVPQSSVALPLLVAEIEREGRTSRLYFKAAKATASITANSAAICCAADCASAAAAAGTPLLPGGSDTLSPALGGGADGGALPPLGLPASTSALSAGKVFYGAAAVGGPSSSLPSAQPASSANKAEPVLETHAKRLWLPWLTVHGPLVATAAPSGDDSSAYAPIAGEFAEVPTALVDAGYITAGAVVECLMRRQGSSRWWEYTKTVANPSTVRAAAASPFAQIAVGAPATEQAVAWLSSQTYLSFAELQWLPNAYTKTCTKCRDVSEKGERDPQTGQFRCNACWRDSGFGDCVHCQKGFVAGSIEVASKAFYCESCWQSFTHAVTITHGPQPPPTGANLELQVMTRVASNLIDEISRKFPLRDVLDLSVPDTSVVRKWVYTGVEHFTGVATDSAVAAQCDAVKGNFLRDHPTKHRSNFSVFPCPYAMADLDRFWEEIRVRHPKQFSAIFCFTQLHKVFSSKYTARDFFRYVSRALVPGGVFAATFFCGNGYFEKGVPYKNDYFSLKWNIKAYEEARARMLAGLPPLPTPTTAAGSPIAAAGTDTNGGCSSSNGDAALSSGASGIAKRDSAATPIPSSIDEPAEVSSSVAQRPNNGSPVPSNAMLRPVDGDDEVEAACASFGSGGEHNQKGTSNNTNKDTAATAAECPATPQGQVQREQFPQPLDPTAASTAAAAGPSEASTSPVVPGDSPIAPSDLPTPNPSCSSNVTPLVVGKGAWRPKGAALSPSAGVSPTAAPAPAPTPAAPEAPVTTDLTIPAVGLTYQVSFNEAGGSGAGTAMTREGSSAVWSEDTPLSPTASSDSAAFLPPSRATTTMFTEGLRTENAIPLDLLCGCAEECGFELVFDFWGKASDVIAADGSWTKPLNPAVKEYFNGVKTVVFKKSSKRPHVSVNPAPIAL